MTGHRAEGDASRVGNAPVRRGPLARLGELPGNPYGVVESLVGYIAGFVAASLLALSYELASGRHSVVGYSADVTGLVGLWIGFALAAAAGPWRAGSKGRELLRSFRSAYGFSIRLLPDVPLGIAAGLFAQYLLSWVLELPLSPFVPHLYTRLGQPARSLTAGVAGPGLVLLSVLICVGSPLFEELVFRGVLLRGLVGLGRDRFHLGGRTSVGLALLVTSVLFGLAHYKAIELPALIGAGAVFGLLAIATRRLGPGFVAHLTFNTVTIITLVRSH